MHGAQTGCECAGAVPCGFRRLSLLNRFQHKGVFGLSVEGVITLQCCIKPTLLAAMHTMMVALHAYMCVQ